MTISTYAELQTAVQNWTGRTDTNLTNRIPEMIVMFEAVANRRLRTREMELSTSLTPASGSVALPTDYLAWRRVTWTGSPRNELAYVEPSWLQAAYPTSPDGTPTVFTIEGGYLKITPLDTTALEFLYYQKVPALVTNLTNWLLTAHPDLYLYGTLVEAEMFGVNDERAASWKGRRDELLDEVQKLSNKSRGAGQMRIMGITP